MRTRQERFREVIGNFPTGVAIVTACSDAGPAGMTTNAVTSVSLDPLLMLVCFDRSSRTLPVVEESGRYAINLLAADQAEIAAAFASKRVGREKFEGITHDVAHGVPVIDDALGWLVCELRELVPAGDHVIGIGEVSEMDAREGDPLVFHRGRYVRLSGTP